MFNWFQVIFFAFFTFHLAYSSPPAVKLTLLHTNDHHGRFWESPRGEYGLAARATVIQQIRSEQHRLGGHVLLLDAGDVNSGVPHSDHVKAEPDFRGMAMLGYDAMAIGNHEFDVPFQTLMDQAKWAGFPFLSANIYHRVATITFDAQDESSQLQRVFPSHIIKEYSGIKVAIFGLTTEDTPFKSNPLHTEKFFFRTAVEEAKELVPQLRKQADVVIALTHMGHYDYGEPSGDAPGDETLAREVPGIDLIVGGHTHEAVFTVDEVNGTYIVQAQEWGKYLGRVDLELSKKRVKLAGHKLIGVNWFPELEEIENIRHRPEFIFPKVHADPIVYNFLLPYKIIGDDFLNEEVIKSNGYFEGERSVVRHQETNLGNLITRALLKVVGGDVGLYNSGGIRASLSPGTLLYGDILTVLPFRGYIAYADLTGEKLKDYLTEIILNFPPGGGGFPQLSNVELTVDRSNAKVSDIRIGGENLKLNKIYRVVLPEFNARGGDRYPVLKYISSGKIDADVLMKYLKDKDVLKVENYRVSGYLQEI